MSYWSSRGAVVLVVVAMLAVGARAESPDAPADPPAKKARPLLWGIGAGGYFMWTGPSKDGLEAVVSLFPGGRFNRFGVRAVARELESFEGFAVMGGASYVAAAALPRLQLSLHGDAGVYSLDDKTAPIVGGGVETLFWVWGPIALGLDSVGYLFYDGVDSRLALGSTLSLRISR